MKDISPIYFAESLVAVMFEVDDRIRELILRKASERWARQRGLFDLAAKCNAKTVWLEARMT